MEATKIHLRIFFLQLTELGQKEMKNREKQSKQIGQQKYERNVVKNILINLL